MKSERKKAPNGQGSIRQRSNGSYELRMTIGRDPTTGKPIVKSFTSKKQSDLLKIRRQYQRDMEDGIQVLPQSLTVGEWLDTWMNEYLIDIKPGTQTMYSGHIKNHIVPALGSIKLDKLTSVDIQKFCNSLSREKKLSASSVHLIYLILHSALEQAYNVHLIRLNPASSVSLPRINKKEMQVLDTPQIKPFLDALDDSEYSTIAKIALFTGMREGEILGLQWSCIDFAKGTILINKQLTYHRSEGIKGEYEYELSSVKNSKPRKIQPAPYVMDILKTHRQHYIEKRLAIGGEWNDSEFPDLVFTNPTGGHLNAVTLWRHFKNTIKEAGLPEMRFHDLRHTYAVLALKNGDDPKTVQENLGHHSATFTMDVYMHVTDSMREASARRMQDFINEL